MTRMALRRFASGVVLMGCAFVAMAASDVARESDTERAAIQRQREAAQADHDQRVAECRKVFAVTACQERARSTYRLEMRRLRGQELAIDDAERRERAKAHAERIMTKAEAAAQRKPRELDSREPKAKAAKGARPSISTANPAAPSRPHDAQASLERYEARQRQAQSHREAVERRNAQRATQKKAKPLPVPSAASASGT